MHRLAPWLLALPILLATATTQADAAATRTSRPAATRTVALQIDIEGLRGSLQEDQIRRWVRSMARMAEDYCGRFPVDSLQVEVRLQSGRRVGFGQHFQGRRVRIHVGRHTSPETLANDHVLLHELLHTAFPSLDRRHRWMREGLSTYLETMVRAQAGLVRDEDVWARWVGSMPSGLPRFADRGLDHTPTWGRTYWGGAMFWMVVDVELRRATNGRQTLRTLVQGVVRRGGVARQRWTMQRLLRVADAVTGTRVVSRAYRRMALAPGAPNLDAFFQRLGVRGRGSALTFDESAPSARIRRAMTH